MSTPYQEINGPFITNGYTVTFDYLDRNDVRALGYVAATSTYEVIPFSFPEGSSQFIIDLTPPEMNAAYSKIRIYRHTDTGPLVDFVNGTAITEKDLDTAYRQGLYVAQEVATNANASDQREDISADMLPSGVITTSKLGDGAVTVDKLNTNLDLSTKNITLPNNVVDSDVLQTNSVLSSKISNGQVTYDKLANNAVDLDSPKITGILPVANGGTGSAAGMPLSNVFRWQTTLPDADVEISNAHGLGSTPTLINAHLVCTTAIDGYSVGDIVNFGWTQSGNAISLYADSTNIYFLRLDVVDIVERPATTNGTDFHATGSNFDIFIQAFV